MSIFKAINGLIWVADHQNQLGICAEQGEVLLVQKEKQVDEFSFVLCDILQKINNGTDTKEIIVIVPRKKIGLRFCEIYKRPRTS